MSTHPVLYAETLHGRLTYYLDGDDSSPTLLLTQRLRRTIED